MTRLFERARGRHDLITKDPEIKHKTGRYAMVSTLIETGLRLRPLTPHFGAEIEGLNAKEPLTPATVEALKASLMEYKVLFLPKQGLGYEEQERLAMSFGELRFDPLEHTVEGHPGLALVDNVPWFHADWMHQENPPLWSMLQLNAVPEVGGDTLWVDLVQSYEALSEPLRAFLETLTVHQSMANYSGDGSALVASHIATMDKRFEKIDATLNSAKQERIDLDELLARVQPHTQPLVRLIPETGKKNYWVSRAFTRRVNELTQAESDNLLEFLFRHQLNPEYAIRWKWHEGDIAFWDHRTTLHSGIKDYGDFQRHGCRASLAGGRVIPASQVG